MGWTMGLEPHYRDSPEHNRLPGLLLVTDRDHEKSIPVLMISLALLEVIKKVGWTMGLEPTTTGITTRGSTN